MRRLLCAALALALTLAVPAHADRIVIWKSFTPALSTADGEDKMLSAVIDVATQLGIDFDVLPQSAGASCATCPSANLNQNALRTLTVTFGGGSTRSYGGQMFLGWFVGSTITRHPGFNADTLTLSAAWPAKPTAFIGVTNWGANIYRNVAGQCSTGVVGNTAGGYTTANYEVAQYMVGKPYVWKGAPQPYYSRASPLLIDRTNGVTRPRVSMASTSPSYRDNGFSSCTDCDSMPRGATYADSRADTALVWTRQRTTTDPAILVFAPHAYSGGGGPDVPGVTIAQVFAIMDSASGGRIIGQKPGWKPIQSGIGVANAFTRSTSSPSGAELYTHGLKCPTANCDSVYWKAGLDSLNSLGVPYTVWVNTDSLEAYPYEKLWWARSPNATFAPSVWTTLGSTALVSAGNAGRYLNIDPFGGYRSRVLITDDRYNNGTVCNGIDTTTSCLLEYARARLDSVPEFRGRMSNALLAAHYDYIPANRSRGSMPNPDTLAAAMLRSGFRVAVTSVLPLATVPSASWGLDGASANVLPTGLSGGIVKSLRAGVWRQRVRGVGDFSWASTRHYDEDALFDYSGHQGSQVGELLNGALLNDWYPTTLSSRPFYYHSFRSKLNVVVIRMGDLGYQRNTTDNPVRPGWYLVKHYVNAVRSINEFAGRTVWQIVPVDQL